MAGRSVWGGTIQFGMVALPAKLYLATDSTSAVAMNLLCPEHKQRINQKTWCAEGEHELSRSETVKGFEVAKGEYVIVSDEDIESLPLPTKGSIEITGFVKSGEIPGELYFDTPYFIAPDKGGDKAYDLLRAALEKTGRIGIAKLALRDRERLVAITPTREGLLLNTLRWPEEVRASAYSANTPDAKQVEVAASLVEAMAVEFAPESYSDEYRAAFQRMIDAKRGGETVAAPSAPKASAPSADLIEMLKASVERAKSKKAAA